MSCSILQEINHRTSFKAHKTGICIKRRGCELKWTLNWNKGAFTCNSKTFWHTKHCPLFHWTTTSTTQNDTSGRPVFTTVLQPTAQGESHTAYWMFASCSYQMTAVALVGAGVAAGVVVAGVVVDFGDVELWYFSTDLLDKQHKCHDQECSMHPWMSKLEQPYQTPAGNGCQRWNPLRKFHFLWGGIGIIMGLKSSCRCWGPEVTPF